MSNQKNNADIEPSEVERDPDPQSRLKIKPQGGADSLDNAIEQLIAKAEAEEWSREKMVDRVIALHLAGAKSLLSEEDAEEFARQARKLFLEDPRFRE
jgi:hypothetical protein